MVESRNQVPDEDTPALFLDGDFRTPAPLDRRIAAVWLRSTTNNPTDGYDVSLSAAFGSEKVTLKVDEFELEVLFSLKSADIELIFDRCDHILLKSSDGPPEGWNTTRTEEQAGEVRLGAAVDADATLHSPLIFGGAGTAKLKAERQRTRRQSVEYQETHGEWHLIGDTAVRVGREKLLEGCVISDFTGWRVIPRCTDETSGVLARVVVREDWINFDDVEWVKAPNAFRRKLADLFQLTPEKSKRKKLFMLLLRHLAQSELKHHQTDRQATIAVHGIRVRPGSEEMTAADSNPPCCEITIPSKPLEQFLMSDEGHEEGTLVALGVRPELIPTAQRCRQQFFVPEGSPLAALELLRRCYAAQPHSVPIENTSNRLPNELRDFRGLRLVDSRDGQIRLKANPDVNPEVSLRRAVSEAACIQTARSVLSLCPDASPIDIAEAVALELGRPWSKQATKQRHGGAIRRWMVWLEPHLIDPNSSGEAAALVNYATTDRAVAKGRPRTLTPQMLTTLRELFARNVPTREIAERFKVSRQAVYKWRRDLGVDA